MTIDAGKEGGMGGRLVALKQNEPFAQSVDLTTYSCNLDLSSLFHWNTKQLFVYAVAEYSTPTHVSQRARLFLVHVDRVAKRC